MRKVEVNIHIKNESQLKKAIELLEEYNQNMAEGTFFLTDECNNKLYFSEEMNDWGIGSGGFGGFDRATISLAKLKTILNLEL